MSDIEAPIVAALNLAGFPVTPREIARTVAASVSVVNRGIADLAERGLVLTEPDLADGRKRLVSLTPGGRTVAAQLAAPPATTHEALVALEYALGLTYAETLRQTEHIAALGMAIDKIGDRIDGQAPRVGSTDWTRRWFLARRLRHAALLEVLGEAAAIDALYGGAAVSGEVIP